MNRSHPANPIFCVWQQNQEGGRPLRRRGQIRLFGLANNLSISLGPDPARRRVFCLSRDLEHLYRQPTPRLRHQSPALIDVPLPCDHLPFALTSVAASVTLPPQLVGTPDALPLRPVLRLVSSEAGSEPVLSPVGDRTRFLSALSHVPNSYLSRDSRVARSTEHREILPLSVSLNPDSMQAATPLNLDISNRSGEAATFPMPRSTFEAAFILPLPGSFVWSRMDVSRLIVPKTSDFTLSSMGHAFVTRREYRFGQPLQPANVRFPPRITPGKALICEHPLPARVIASRMSPTRTPLRPRCPKSRLRAREIPLPLLITPRDLLPATASRLPAPAFPVASSPRSAAPVRVGPDRQLLTPRLPLLIGPPPRTLPAGPPPKWPRQWSNSVWKQLRRLRLQARALSCPRLWAVRSLTFSLLLNRLVPLPSLSPRLAPTTTPSLSIRVVPVPSPDSYPSILTSRPTPDTCAIVTSRERYALVTHFESRQLEQSVDGFALRPPRLEAWGQTTPPKPYPDFRPMSMAGSIVRMHRTPASNWYAPRFFDRIVLRAITCVRERPQPMVFLATPIFIPARQPPLPRRIRVVSGSYQQLPGFIHRQRRKPLIAYFFTRDSSFNATYLDFKPVRRKIAVDRDQLLMPRTRRQGRQPVPAWTFEHIRRAERSFGYATNPHEHSVFAERRLPKPQFDKRRRVLSPALPPMTPGNAAYLIPQDLPRSQPPAADPATSLGAFPFGFEVMHLHPLELSLSLANPFFPLKADTRSITPMRQALQPKKFFRHFSGAGMREPRRLRHTVGVLSRAHLPFQDSIPFEIAAALPGTSLPRTLRPTPGEHPFDRLPYRMAPIEREKAFRGRFLILSPFLLCRFGNLERLPETVPAQCERGSPRLRGTIMPSFCRSAAQYREGSITAAPRLSFPESLAGAQPVQTSFAEILDVWSMLYRSLPRRQKQRFARPSSVEPKAQYLARFRSLTYPWRPVLDPLGRDRQLPFLVTPESSPTLEDLVGQPFSVTPQFHETFSEAVPHRFDLVTTYRHSPEAFPPPVWNIDRLPWETRVVGLTRGAPKRPRLDRLPRSPRPVVPVADMRFRFQTRRERPLNLVSAAASTSRLHPLSLHLLPAFTPPERRLMQGAPHFVPEAHGLLRRDSPAPLAYPVPFRTQERILYCSLLTLAPPSFEKVAPREHPSDISSPQVPERSISARLPAGTAHTRFVPSFCSNDMAPRVPRAAHWSATLLLLSRASPCDRDPRVLVTRPERPDFDSTFMSRPETVADQVRFFLSTSANQRPLERPCHQVGKPDRLPPGTLGLPDWIDLPNWVRPPAGLPLDSESVQVWEPGDQRPEA